MSANDSPSAYSQYQNRFQDFSRWLSFRVRRQMYDALVRLAHVGRETTILDVGVTNDEVDSMNFLEALHPHPDRITAAGVEDASFLEKKYPGLKYVQIQPGRLPFEDQSFDVVFSSAVIEHVGSREQQRQFIAELCRVGRSCVFTTPNRWFPIEFHTVMPLVHWLPPATFRSILRRVGRDFYAHEETLNLLAEGDVMNMLPPGRSAVVKRYRLLGWVSNLLFYIPPA